MRYEPNSLDAVFAALADPTRRAILERLSEADATVTELTEIAQMSQPATSKHLNVLGHAGLITRSRDRRYRVARLNPVPLGDAYAWLETYRQFWTESFDRLDLLLERMQAQAPSPAERADP